jgi:hypothetical protein
VVDVVVVFIAMMSTENMLLYVISNKGKLVVTTGSIFTLQYIYGPEGVHHSRRKSQITFD